MKTSKITRLLLLLAAAVTAALIVAVPAEAASWKKSIVKQNKIKIENGKAQTNTFVEFTVKNKTAVTIVSADSAGEHYGGNVFKGTSAQLAKDFLDKKYNEDAWYDNILYAESEDAKDDKTYSKTYLLDEGTYTFYMSTIKKSSVHMVKISAKKPALKFRKMRTLQIFTGMF